MQNGSFGHTEGIKKVSVVLSRILKKMYVTRKLIINSRSSRRWPLHSQNLLHFMASPASAETCPPTLMDHGTVMGRSKRCINSSHPLLHISWTRVDSFIRNSSNLWTHSIPYHKLTATQHVLILIALGWCCRVHLEWTVLNSNCVWQIDSFAAMKVPFELGHR